MCTNNVVLYNPPLPEKFGYVVKQIENGKYCGIYYKNHQGGFNLRMREMAETNDGHGFCMFETIEDARIFRNVHERCPKREVIIFRAKMNEITGVGTDFWRNKYMVVYLGNKLTLWDFVE